MLQLTFSFRMARREAEPFFLFSVFSLSPLEFAAFSGTDYANFASASPFLLPSFSDAFL